MICLSGIPRPSLLASLKVCVIPLRAVLILAFLLVYVILLRFLLYFAFDLDVVCFSLSCAYYAVSSVSVSAAVRIAYDMNLIRTYADLTVLSLSEGYDLFQFLSALPSVYLLFS